MLNPEAPDKSAKTNTSSTPEVSQSKTHLTTAENCDTDLSTAAFPSKVASEIGMSRATQNVSAREADSISQKHEISRDYIWKTPLLSNTTYSFLGTAIFAGLVSSVPEAAIAHLIIGVISVYNETKVKKLTLHSDLPKVNSVEQNSNSLFNKILKDPALYRVAQCSIFTASLFAAALRGNFVDTLLFASGALATAATVRIIRKESRYSIINKEGSLNKLLSSIKEKTPEPLKNLLSDPGPPWIISGLFSGIRNVSKHPWRESLVISTSVAASVSISLVGLAISAAQVLFKKDLPKTLTTNISAYQCAGFAAVNFMVGEAVMGVCLSFWGISALLTARAMTLIKPKS